MPYHGHASISPAVMALLRRAAIAKGILRGRPEAILDCLEQLADGLLPAPDLFSLFFSPSGDAEGGAVDLREIGCAFWEGAAVSRAERRLEGSFYTPVAVIDQIIHMVWKDAAPGGDKDNASSPTVCDPALGCGFFPLRLIERMLATRSLSAGAVREWAAHCLYGVDVDAPAVFMARALLWLALSDAKTVFMPDPGHFRLGDSLLGPAFGQRTGGDGLDWGAAFPGVGERGGFDVIFGNPPYEVLTNFSRHGERRELADALRACGFYQDALRGQLNLYRCFIERSLDLLRPGGVLSFVVPLSLARDAAALPLRRRLLERDASAEWILFGERDNVFPGVTQSACVFKARRDGGRAARLTVAARGDRSRLTLDELQAYSGGALTIPSLDREGMKLWKWLWRHAAGRVEDAAEMRVGDVDQTVYRDCMSDRDTGCILARGAHLSPFHLDVRPLPGKERFLDLERFLAKRGGSAEACRERADVWRVAQLGIRNMHSRPRLVAALVPPGVYLGNSLNVYRPKEGVSLDYLAGMLNSALLDWLFCLGSGNNNINLQEMRPLPFPVCPEAELVAAVEGCFRDCSQAASLGESLAESWSRLNQAAAACFGVPGDLVEKVLGS